MCTSHIALNPPGTAKADVCSKPDAILKRDVACSPRANHTCHLTRDKAPCSTHWHLRKLLRQQVEISFAALHAPNTSREQVNGTQAACCVHAGQRWHAPICIQQEVSPAVPGSRVGMWGICSPCWLACASRAVASTCSRHQRALSRSVCQPSGGVHR